MKRLATIVFAAAALVLSVGCDGGKKGLNLKAGDKLEVVENLERIRFEAFYGESAANPSSTDGDRIEIPAGTILEVYVTPRGDAHVLEVVPVKAGDITEASALRDMFIQERFRRDRPFLYYTITIPSELIGSKIKKVE